MLTEMSFTFNRFLGGEYENTQTASSFERNTSDHVRQIPGQQQDGSFTRAENVPQRSKRVGFPGIECSKFSMCREHQKRRKINIRFQAIQKSRAGRSGLRDD